MKILITIILPLIFISYFILKIIFTKTQVTKISITDIVILLILTLSLGYLIDQRQLFGMHNKIYLITSVVLLSFYYGLNAYYYLKGKFRKMLMLIILLLTLIIIIFLSTLQRMPNYYRGGADSFKLENNNEVYFYANNELVGYDKMDISSTMTPSIYQNEEQLCFSNFVSTDGFNLKSGTNSYNDCNQVVSQVYKPYYEVEKNTIGQISLGSVIMEPIIQVEKKEETAVATTKNTNYNIDKIELEEIPYYLAFNRTTSSLEFKSLTNENLVEYELPTNKFDLSQTTEPVVKIGVDEGNICINNNLTFATSQLHNKVIQPVEQSCQTKYYLGDNDFSINYGTMPLEQHLNKIHSAKPMNVNATAYTKDSEVEQIDFKLNAIAGLKTTGNAEPELSLIVRPSGNIIFSSNLMTADSDPVLFTGSEVSYQNISAIGQDENGICLGGEYKVTNEQLKSGNIKLEKEECQIDYAQTIVKSR